MIKATLTKDVFHVPVDRGAAALVAGLSKPGYEFVRMERKGTRCVVTWRRKIQGRGTAQ